MNRETVALLRDEAARYNISIRTELAANLPQIVADRVQLQQVAMNLIVNSIEAMKDVDGIREMVIKSQRAENEQVLVSVSDTGVGLRRNWQNRFSTRSLRPNSTAPAWDYASAGQLLSRMVGACGRSAPLGAAQPFM
jgi:signal transduction histidine kinase